MWLLLPSGFCCHAQDSSHRAAEKAARSEIYVFKIGCAHDYPHRNEPESTEQPSLMTYDMKIVISNLSTLEIARMCILEISR